MKRAFVFFIVALLLVSAVFAAYGTNKAPSPSSSSGGGGSGVGGGGGGGSVGSTASSSQAGQAAKVVWSSIDAGRTATAAIKDNALGVTEISFVVPEKVYNAWIQVAKRETLPKSVSTFGGKVYKSLEISKESALAEEGSFTDAKIKFKVEKTWLAENTLTKEAVALFRYSDDSWNQLPTLGGQDDGTYVYYTAQTPGFSYFIIGEKLKEAVPATESSVEGAMVGEALQAPPAPVDKQQTETEGGTAIWMVAVALTLILIFAGIIIYLSRKE